MADQQQGYADFEATYNSTLEALIQQEVRGSSLESWKFIDEVRSNTGADGYYPEWVLPYSLFVSNVTDKEGGDRLHSLRAAILRAAQLGYTEGYFAGKDD